MSTLYQSPLWRSINESIYKKPIFEISLGGREYRGTIKQMRIAGQEVRRSMLHGISFSSLDHFDTQFQQDLLAYKRDHKTGRDLFLQVGVDMPIATYATTHTKRHEEDALQKMSYIERDFLTWYDLRPTCREHMPHATILLDTVGTLEDWKRNCSDSGKRMINKGNKAGLTFELITEEKERRAYRKMRYTMSYDKGFSVISEEHFIALMDMLTTLQSGRLFVAKKDGEIVSGSVCLAHEQQLIYLYGATERAFGNIGAHYRLTIHIRGRARDHHYEQFDLLGIAPPGSGEDHTLAGVTRFKQSFGGTTVIYAGSYDCICSPWGYRAFKTWRTMKS